MAIGLGMIGWMGPEEAGAEAVVSVAVSWLRLGVETLGALVVFWGLAAVLRLVWLRRSGFGTPGFAEARLVLARHLALALELQLGADILSTAIAPGWNQIGKLAAIAIIRTALNYFLQREINEEQAARGGADQSRSSRATA